MIRILPPLAALVLAACAPAKDDGVDPEGKTFDRVGPEEIVTLTGTEPFWNLRIEGGEGVWAMPDNQPGARLTLRRFAGNNGLGFTGTLGGKPFAATLTPGACSDGMSDRRYPFVATIALGGETFEGCGYTTSQPFSGSKTP